MKRRAFTLLELTIAVSVSTVFIGIAVGLLQGLLQLGSAARSEARSANVLGALAQQFRADVHQATTAEAESGRNKSLSLRLPGGRSVVYQIKPREISRHEQGGNGPAREESYAINPQATAAIEVEKGPVKMVSLSIRSPGPAAGPAIRIRAALARDHRFVMGGPDSSAIGVPPGTRGSVIRQEEPLAAAPPR
jgi:prepilin-type N-terminal cleavage/methylation domain-containing protein